MLEALKSLTQEEQQIMIDAIPYITLLVAGSEGDIDMKDVEWGEKLTKIRAFSFEEELQPFYRQVSENFEERLRELLPKLPGEKEPRDEAISQALSRLNDILPKIDHFYARTYYQGLKSFAEHVAQASGGVMGWLSVSFQEYKVIDLHMIEPIE